MIRINLLGVQKAKGKRGSPTAAAAPSMGEGGSILVKAAGAAQAGGSELSAGPAPVPVLSTKAAASPNATRRVT